MKGKDIALLIGGGLAAYMLIPKETRERLIPSGSGSAMSLGLDLNLPEIKMPSFNIGDIGIPQIPAIIPEIPDPRKLIPDIPEVPNVVPDIPGIKEILDIFKNVDLTGKDGGGLLPGIPGVPDLAGTGLDLFGKLGEIGERYFENFGKGILGFAEAADFYTGGWQEDNSVMAWFRKMAFPVNATVTDYAKAALERGTRIPATISPEAISNKEAPAASEFSGGSAPGYTPIKPMSHPGIPGVSIVGVLSGSPTPIGSIGTQAPPTKAERWMYT